MSCKDGVTVRKCQAEKFGEINKDQFQAVCLTQITYTRLLYVILNKQHQVQLLTFMSFKTSPVLKHVVTQQNVTHAQDSSKVRY